MRTRTTGSPASSAGDSGTSTRADAPDMIATLVVSLVWRSCQVGVLIFSVLPKRVYLANPAEPPASTRLPLRCRCAARRLSTSEYTACSGPRAGALAGVLVGAAVPAVEPVPVPVVGGGFLSPPPLQAIRSDGTSATSVVARGREVIAEP